MASLNRVLLIGNLGADPELSYTPSGTAKAVFRLATHEFWTQKDGSKGERTEWHRIIAWGRLAEIVGEYLVKGRQVFVEGRIQTRSWDDENGVKKFMTEIVINNMQMLGNNRAPATEVEEPKEGEYTPSEDMPFDK